jgi:hypothetical protein
MFTAYFDASGKESGAIISMAGFVSRVQKWQRFEAQWRSLLPSGIDAFHFTDFASSKKGWEQWRDKHTERAILVSKLVRCIRDNTNKGFACSLEVPDYQSINRRLKLRETVGRPYVFVGKTCLGGLQTWANSKGIDHRRILCIFEDGDEGIGELIASARKEGYNAIAQSKKDVRAFDSSDFAAWKSRVLTNNGIVQRLQDEDEKSATKILKSLNQLESVVQANRTYGTTAILRVCKRLNVPPR